MIRDASGQTVRVLTLVLVALAGLVIGWQVAAAASDIDGPYYLSYGGCTNTKALSAYDTGNPSNYGHSETSRTTSCTTMLINNAFYWKSSISDFYQIYDDSTGLFAGSWFDHEPITNVYGYHQTIVGSNWSPTFETHPQ